MVERLAPDGVREMFQRVVTKESTRPQGGGRRRYGEREVLTAISITQLLRRLDSVYDHDR
ncbi:hypothetical protein HEP87_51685 [Streptomyces sp. S1D4-11]|nr:hypothetical protein [Streptomyces sp. S1D4-11]QIZ00665.1 hypothetical protein HEP87_51685 [Streptomyces sp. S1D4-11]